jgi:hypothetical protein
MSCKSSYSKSFELDLATNRARCAATQQRQPKIENAKKTKTQKMRAAASFHDAAARFTVKDI